MDGRQFDALTKRFAGGATRRRLLVALGALVSGGLAAPAAAATKRRGGQVCGKHGDCASNVCLPKDRTGRRYCQSSQAEVRDAPSDCVNTDCVEGHCCAATDFCEGTCCSPNRAPTETCCLGTSRCCECFRRTDPGRNQIECCPPEKLCKHPTNSPASDECCHSDEICVNGDCCWEGQVCEGRCCDTPCCNGVCCPFGQECAIAPGQTVASCQAPRTCNQDSQCNTAVGETCQCTPAEVGEACQAGSGVCCPSGRQITFTQDFDGELVTIKLCCHYGQGQSPFDIHICCDLPDLCGTSRGGFSRF